jgi:hypothetical protein
MKSELRDAFVVHRETAKLIFQINGSFFVQLSWFVTLSVLAIKLMYCKDRACQRDDS